MNVSVDTSIAKRTGQAQPVDTLKLLGGVIVNVFEAKSFFSRLRGLHAVWPLADNEALVIRPCNAIHTLTMRSAIDVVFVDAAGVVLKAVTVSRFRFRRCADACAVIELPEGAIRRLRIVVGDVLVRDKGVWK